MTREELLHILHRDHDWSEGAFTIWERAGFRCSYCGMNHLASLDTSKLGQLDHVLPKTKYPNLDESDSNRVLACDICNKLKRNWDPNKDGGEPIVGDEATSITSEQRDVLLDRAKRRVVELRIAREKKFLKEKELILKWQVDRGNA